MSKKLCEICGLNKATIPDRNRMPGRMIDRICSSCNGRRLVGDMMAALASKAERDREDESRRARGEP